MVVPVACLARRRAGLPSSTDCAQAASEVEETLKRLQSHKGVEAILIVNHDGVPLRSTMTVEQTKKYAEHMSSVSRSRWQAASSDAALPCEARRGRPAP